MIFLDSFLFKRTGKCQELIHEGTGDSLVPFCIEVEPVPLGIGEELDLLFHHGIQPAESVEVDHGHAPNVGCLLDRFDIVMDI